MRCGPAPRPRRPARMRRPPPDATERLFAMDRSPRVAVLRNGVATSTVIAPFGKRL